MSNRTLSINFQGGRKSQRVSTWCIRISAGRILNNKQNYQPEKLEQSISRHCLVG